MKIDSYLDHIYQRTFFQMARKKKVPPVFNNHQLKAAASWEQKLKKKKLWDTSNPLLCLPKVKTRISSQQFCFFSFCICYFLFIIFYYFWIRSTISFFFHYPAPLLLKLHPFSLFSFIFLILQSDPQSLWQY